MQLVSRLLAFASASFFLVMGALVSTAAAQPPASFADHGTFILFLEGHKIGTERFQVRSLNADIRASATVEFAVQSDGKTLKFKTFPNLLLDSRLDPVSYDWEQKGAESSRIDIDFRHHPAQVRFRTVRGRKDYREFYLHPDVVILDDNIVDQYELLAWRYFMAGGGNQAFAAFIPQEGIPGRVEVSRLADTKIEAAGRKRACRHLLVTTNQARINLWVDSAGRLLRMEKSSSHFAAVRQ